MTMARKSPIPFELVGVIRVRSHCSFRWHEPEGGGLRSAEVGPEHCETCLQELRRLRYRLVRSEGSEGRGGGGR